MKNEKKEEIEATVKEVLEEKDCPLYMFSLEELEALRRIVAREIRVRKY